MRSLSGSLEDLNTIRLFRFRLAFDSGQEISNHLVKIVKEQSHLNFQSSCLGIDTIRQSISSSRVGKISRLAVTGMMVVLAKTFLVQYATF